MSAKLDIVRTYVCPSTVYYGTEVLGNKGVYTVEYKKIKQKHDWFCSCPAMIYYADRGHCKHIQRVKKIWCGWNNTCEYVEYPKDGRCPNCGRPVISVLTTI